MRLILFDLDGTLVWTRGMGRRALDAAFRSRYGWDDATGGLSFGGMTDPWIVARVFEKFGRSADDAAREQEEFFHAYVQALARIAVREVEGAGALPGVRPLLDALAPRRDCEVGVLTGNVAGGAFLKLMVCELGGYLPLLLRVSAFGDEAAARSDLLPLALERAHTLLGARFAPADAVIVGDTPRDIEVARAHGARAVAVATGTSDRPELAACEPDVLLDDLSDTGAVLSALLP